MAFPSFNETDLTPHLSSPQLFSACIQQTEKDLYAYGIHISTLVPGASPLRDLLLELQPQLELLLQRGTQIQEILYRVDVPEKLLQKALIECPNMPLHELISRLIILRELQKVITRQSLSNNNAPSDWKDV
jgi:hypothetical protein